MVPAYINMNAPLPFNERERLQELRRYAILDTPPEPAFDRITRLVAKLLNVPISIVTLVDEERQWFKSSCGVPMQETSRELSFCAHAILCNEMMVVSDLAHDKRFLDHALVKGEPHVRFYAGAPLRSAGGFNLGTLCVVDVQPRELSAGELEILGDLSAVVADELELRLAIRERSQLAAAIFHLNSGVAITDATLTGNPISFVNPGFQDMTGYLPEEAMGRECLLLQGAQTDLTTVARLDETIAARSTFHGELLNYRKDGTPFWNELTVSPVFNAAGGLTSFVWLQSDVTDRKRTADQLLQNFEKLKELEALRDNLTGMIVHDLRSPLTGIIGFLELLQRVAGQNLTPEQMGFIEKASGSAGKLRDMITSLLDVNRLEEGKMPLNLQLADLREILTMAINPFAAAIGSRSLTVDMPELPVEVRCDMDLVQRVIANLVGNAIKFTPEGGEIRVAISHEGDKATVSVTDTGRGIRVEDHVRIFEKFGQVQGQQQRHSTGLGLTFCKLAIEAQGGAIGVKNNEGKGVTFWFVLERR